MRVNIVDLTPEPGDTPRRMYDPNGRHSVEFAGTWGPTLRLGDLDENQQVKYLRDLARECDLLIQDIERAKAAESNG